MSINIFLTNVKLFANNDNYSYVILLIYLRLQVERLKELGIPSGPIYGKLKKGETVIAPSGDTVSVLFTCM